MPNVMLISYTPDPERTVAAAARLCYSPSTIDQVMVGDITRTRLDGVQVLFFVGVNDGVVPQRKNGGSLLGDSFFQDFFSAPAISAGETAESAGEKEHLVSEEESRQVQRQRELNALRLEMKRAVESENFERAAELRDQIHAKEKEN